jgi:hypothetical protein
VPSRIASRRQACLRRSTSGSPSERKTRNGFQHVPEHVHVPVAEETGRLRWMSTASGRSISATISRILRAAAAESPCSALAGTSMTSACSPLTRSPTLASTWRRWVERLWQSSSSWHLLRLAHALAIRSRDRSPGFHRERLMATDWHVRRHTPHDFRPAAESYANRASRNGARSKLTGCRLTREATKRPVVGAQLSPMCP